MSVLTKSILFLILIFFATAVQAEYYLECQKPVFNFTTINCKGHHCRFNTQHATNYQRHRAHRPVKYCDQDSATGDDNPCRHPDMQIN